jgi:hypothetical protein
MRLTSLQLGDLVEVNIRGNIFRATVRSKAPGLVGIMPNDSKRFSWRFAKPHQIVRRVERQQGMAA